jgi:rod shape-determining protein MreC
MTPSPRPLNLGTLLALALVAAVLTMWQHSAERHSSVSLPERLFVAVGRPLERAFDWGQQWPRNLLEAVVDGPRLVDENHRLQRELDEEKAKETEEIQSWLTYRALVQQLGLPTPNSTMEGAAARVIALETGPSRCRATISVARGVTVSEGDIVRQASGLVGRVIGVQGNTAEVLLLIDPEAAVAALDRSSGDQGIVDREPALSLTATRLRMAMLKPTITDFPDLRAGDQIVSSGLDQVFPSGIPIGRVDEVIKSPGSAESITAILRPAVDFFKLEYVLVIPKPKK